MAQYDISDVNLFIAIPAYDGKIPVELAQGIASTYGWFKSRGKSPVVQFEKGNALVAYARNSLVYEFLSTDCTHMLFVDGDINFKVEDVLRLMALGTKHPVIGATYPIKKDETRYHIHLGDREYPVATDDGLLYVSGLGMGFTMIQRRVFEETKDQLRVYNDRSQASHRGVRRITEYFREDIVDEELTGEDVFFFKYVCEKNGFRPVLDWQIDLGHIGTKEYRGDLPNALCKMGWLEPTNKES